MNKFNLLELYFVLSFLVLSCARGGEQVAPPSLKKQIQLILTVKGTVDTTTGKYYILFDTNNNSGDGPYIDKANNWCSFTYYIEIKNNAFYFVEKNTLSDGTVSFTTTPLSSGEGSGNNISSNTISLILDLCSLGNPSKLEINFFTVDNNNTPLDALGDGFNSATSFISMDTTTGLTKEFQDPEDCSNINFDIISGKIGVSP